MKKTQSGFSSLELILVVIILGLIGFVGVYVFNAQKNASNTYATASKDSTSPTVAKEVLATFTQENDPTTGFKYPKSWKISGADSELNFDGGRNVSVASSNGTAIVLSGAGAGVGGECQPGSRSKVIYVKKIAGAKDLYVVEWSATSEGNKRSGLNVMNSKPMGVEEFTSSGEHDGCIDQYFRFSSTTGNGMGYYFGVKSNDGNLNLNPKDSAAAKQILGSLTVQ